MQRDTRCRARIAGICPSENPNVCSSKRWDGRHREHAVVCLAVVDVFLQLGQVVNRHVGSELQIIEKVLSRTLIAHAFQNSECGNHERMVLDDERCKRRVNNIASKGE